MQCVWSKGVLDGKRGEVRATPGATRACIKTRLLRVGLVSSESAAKMQP